MTIQIGGLEQNFPDSVNHAGLVVVSYEYMDEILNYDHSNESQRKVRSCGAFYYSAQCSLMKVTIQLKATEQYPHLVLLLCCTRRTEILSDGFSSVLF